VVSRLYALAVQGEKEVLGVTTIGWLLVVWNAWIGGIAVVSINGIARVIVVGMCLSTVLYILVPLLGRPW
jgi:hypothetical protein